MKPERLELASILGLLCLPEMGPVRLRALIGEFGPVEAWERVCRGRLGPQPLGLRGDQARLAARWRHAASAVDPPTTLRAHEDAGVEVLRLGADRYPEALAEDLEPPEVLFARGALAALDHRRIAIVGTRRCTSYGAQTARGFGRELADAGISVVSGLALGIDAAAHLGALESSTVPPIGVVGTGLDVVYPPRNRGLWSDVAERGLLLSESPLGTRANAWRFPARNRIIAALAQVVVVVESHANGGSLHTVREAVARDREVVAVPGPIRAPESAGTNTLLFDGHGPARSSSDVLGLLGLVAPATDAERSASDGSARGSLSDLGCRLLDRIGTETVHVDEIVLAMGLPLAEVAIEIQRLVSDGWLVSVGARVERCR